MPKEVISYETAIERFWDGCCPYCGEKVEYRERSGDYFCHQCKEEWSGEKVLALKEKLLAPEGGKRKK